MAIAETAARKLLHGGGGGAAVARGVAAAGTFGFGLDGLWQLISGFFADIVAHLLGALAGAAHLLILPFEALWRLLLAAVAGAAGAISAGLGGLWHLVAGFFANLFAAAAGAISGMWQLVAGFFPHLFAAVAGAAHDLAQHLEAFWCWLQAAAAAALPYALAVAAVLLLAALVWFCGPALCAAAVGVCKALVSAACYFGYGLYRVGVAVHQVLACLLPRCVMCAKWCASATMKAPGAAGYLISRAAFVANPALYFQILRAAGPVVASAVFCAKFVASAVAAPIAALFRASVGA